MIKTMKYINYIIMSLLLCFVASSCSDKDPDFDWTAVDHGTKARVQVMYMTPVASAVANRIYRLEINGKTYENNGAALISNFNGTPSGGVSVFYDVDAGPLRIRLWKQPANMKYQYSVNGSEWHDKRVTEGDNIDKFMRLSKDGENWGESEPILSYRLGLKNWDDALIYDQTSSAVEAGKHYSVIVHLLDREPTVIERGTIPSQTTVNTAEYACVRFYNFMFEDATTPYPNKLQLRLKNTTTGDYENVCDPIGFGEATPWFMPSVVKTVFNSSGSQRRDLDLVIVDNSGQEVGNLTYTRSNGSSATFTDYWTLAIGRAYSWWLYGTRGEKTVPVAITSFAQN